MKRTYGSLVAVLVSLLLTVGCTDSQLEQAAPDTDATVGSSNEAECSKCETECSAKSECSAESACSKSECASKEECSLCESECKGKAETEEVGHEEGEAQEDRE